MKKPNVFVRGFNKFCESLGNSEKFNTGVYVFGATVIAIGEIAIAYSSYFRGMRRGVDMTDAFYERREKKVRMKEGIRVIVNHDKMLIEAFKDPNMHIKTVEDAVKFIESTAEVLNSHL